MLDVNGNRTAFNNSNGLLSPGGEWHVSKPLSAFQDQLTFKKAIEGGHNVSLGAYFANYSQTNQWYFTDILMDVRDNPHFVDLRVDSADVYYHYRNRTTGANDSALVQVRNLAAPQLALAMGKKVSLRENVALMFKAEAFNLTNTPLFGGPSTANPNQAATAGRT